MTTAVVVAMASIGCAESGGRVAPVLVRDSAGIEVVESRVSLWGHDTAVPVARDLIVQVGSPAGPGALHDVGPVRWLDSTHIVISNLDAEVRIYDLEGALVSSFGGPGEGPGEYRRISGLAVRADGSIVVTDSRLGRISIIDRDGSLISTTAAPGGLSRSPSLIAETWLVGHVPGNVDINGERSARVSDSVAAVNLASGERTTWATSPGRRIVWRTLPNGLGATPSVALGPGSRVAGRDDRVVYGSSDRYELTELDSTGRVVRILRRIAPARPVTAEHERPFLEAWERQGSPPFAEPEFADSLPHFRSILLDDLRRTWVQIDEGFYRPALEWEVFNADGALLGRVALPPAFVPHDILGQRVVGTWRDSLDIEYVQVRDLVLPGR